MAYISKCCVGRFVRNFSFPSSLSELRGYFRWHSLTWFRLKDRVWTIQLTMRKPKDRFGRRVLAFRLKDRVWTIQFNIMCSSKLKDLVWAMQFSIRYSSKLKDRVGRCNLALFRLKDRVGRYSLTWCTCLS